jgi:VCBS repeat-containing protein/probable HAF family extracellular repeat protein
LDLYEDYMSIRRYLSRRFVQYRLRRAKQQARRANLVKPCWRGLEGLEPRVLLSTAYAISDLGVPANTDSSYARDINNSAIVVGYATESGLFPVTRAFVYDPATGMQDLGTLGGDDAGATAINDVGQIAGWAYDAAGKIKGFRYDPGTGMFDLGGLGTNAGVYPQGINAAGAVVGTSFYNGMQVAFLYTDAGGIQIAGGAPSSTRTYLGYDVNDAGKIVGYSYPIGAFITGPDGVGVGTLGTGWAYAVNNSDQVTGSTGAFDPDSHLFRYTPGVGVVDLGSLPGGETVGLDINAAGQIVGKGKAGDGVDHAIYWDDADGLVDLNHLIAPESGWFLQSATGLNDQGQIVGSGVINGQTRAFVLTPDSGTDATAPSAGLEADDILAGGVSTFEFRVVWWDQTAVDITTLDSTDVTVAALDGTELPVTFVGVDVAGNGIRRVATYSIEAPGVAWGAQDNGPYSVTVNAGEVTDTLGQSVTGGSIGSFTVAIDAHVTAQIAGAEVGQVGVAAAFNVSAQTTSTYDPAETFTFHIDWDGNGSVDQTVVGPTGTPVEHAFVQDGTFNVRVTATDAYGVSSASATHAILVTPEPGYQTWEFATALPTSTRTSMAAVNDQGTIYLLGGQPYVNEGEEGAVHLLAPGATGWQVAQHLDSGRLEDVGAGIDNTGQRVVFGGTREGQPTTTTFAHSLQDGKGDALAPKSFAVTNFAYATDATNLLYAIGGRSADGSVQTSVERYNGASDSWQTIAALPEARSHATAVYDGQGHILVIGGLDASGTRRATVYSYDVAADTWAQAADLPTAVSQAAAVLGADGLVYAIGGDSAAGAASSAVYNYNPTSGAWSTGQSMQQARSDFAAVAGDDGYIYAIGGQTNSVERIDTNASGQAPIAVDDDVNSNEDQQIVINVLSNDADPDGDALTVIAVDLTGTRGSLVINANSTITYTPAADDVGVDTFGYTISDPSGRTTSAQVAVTLTSDGMTAGNDSSATDEDTPVGSVADLLGNDASSNAGALLTVTATNSTSLLGAAVTVNADGTFNYDPTNAAALQSLSAGATIVDAFEYTVADGTGASETGKVTVTVTGVNDAPIARDDAVVVGYTINIIAPAGAISSTVQSINNLGHAVGSFTDELGTHGFLYDGTTFTNLTDPGGNALFPTGVNDADVVVGSTNGKGYIFDGTNYVEHQYGLRTTSFAEINNNDLVVGSYAQPWTSYSSVAVGLTYQNGSSFPFNHPDNVTGRGNWLVDASDTGLLVGNYYPSFYGSSRGFVYDGLNYTDILVPGAPWTNAAGVNNQGHVVGMQIRDNGADRFGFIYNGSTYEPFRYPGSAGWTALTDINDAGVITGYGAGKGFIARPASATDKHTVFAGRVASLLGNDTDIDSDDSLALVLDTVTSQFGATVSIHADGRFDYDPTESATLQALGDGQSVTDTFVYTVTDGNAGTSSATASIAVSGTNDAGMDPSATATVTDIDARGGAYQFSVTYSDDVAISVASLDDADIRVTGPNGFDTPAIFLSVDTPTDGQVRTATYRIAAPGGEWDGADNGTYTLSMQSGQVTDTDGNAVPALPLGAFQVAIDATPLLAVSGPTLTNVGTTATFTFSATSSYPASAADVFVFDIDWEADGTIDQSVTGQTGTQVNHVFTTGGAQSIVVTARDVHGLVSAPLEYNLFATSYQVWETAPGFSFYRTGATGLNHNGTLMVIGGRPFSPDAALDGAVHYLPPGGNQWLQGPYLEGKIEGQGVGIDQLGRIIVFDGFEPGHGHAGGEYVYDLTNGPTDGIAARVGAPWGFALATDEQNYIYALGGQAYTGSGPSVTTAERYNAVADTWELLAPMPAPRVFAAGVYDGQGHILVIGGSTTGSGADTNTVFTYDIATNTWLDDPYNDRYYMPKAPGALLGARAVLGADGVVYVMQGTRTYMLDPQTRAWALGPGMPHSHNDQAAVLGNDGYIYAISGNATVAVDKINTIGGAAPQLLAAPQAEAIVGEAFNAGAFINANPQPTYTLVTGPTGMAVDRTSGVLNWTPAFHQLGLQDVTLDIANAYGQAQFTFSINVLALPRDVHAPDTPANLHQIDGDLDSITFTWDAATDDRGVDHYKLYRWIYVTRFRKYWGVVADNIVGTEYTHLPAVNGRYRVSAVDAAGNESWASAETSAALYTVPVLSHSATNANEFIYAIVGAGLYVGDNSQSFTPAPYLIADGGNPQSTLSVLAGPAGVTVDSSTRAVTWVPGTADIGTQSITIHGDNPVGAADFTFNVDVYPAGTDLIKPTTIATPTVTTLTHQGATIQWNTATDNVAVIGQRVYGRLVGTTTSFVVADLTPAATSYTITSFEPDTRYMLWVAAYDAAGNEGPHVGPVYPLFITTLAALNAPPVAIDDGYTAREDTPLVVDALLGVLFNDTDADPLTATLTSGPAHGTLTFNPDGAFTYTPTADYNGLDAFVYTASDGPSTSNPATVTINVTPVNDAPGAGWDTYWINEDTTLVTTTANGLFANDFDIDGDTFTMTQLTSLAHGILVLNSDGTFSYTPNADFTGTDLFTYQNNDGQLNSNLARVTFVVLSVNDAPVAVDDPYDVDQDTILDVSSALGILANDTNIDGDTLTATLVNAPAHGSLILNSNGSFTYTPNANFNGADSFGYVANDGASDSNLAVVSITVNPTAPPPPPPPPSGTQFFVVDDAVDDTFEYAPDGALMTSYNLAPANGNARGAAASPDGTRLWVVDKSATVHVYDSHGNALGAWQLETSGKTSGIATDGIDIWIVDRKLDKVFYYQGAAARLSGSAAPDSSFALTTANRRPAGITTDGQHLWIVDDGRSKDRVFKYTLAGSLLGYWSLDSANTAATGITIDPTGLSESIWIVDGSTDSVYEYATARARVSGSSTADSVFALAPGNTNPQGIADPPAGSNLPSPTSPPVAPAQDDRASAAWIQAFWLLRDLHDADDISWHTFQPPTFSPPSEIGEP